ncbi:MAG: aromatic ring-hydroxylating dioxygenase subunit alpha [Myxococcota bacterium]|nr:aromatic ring-hydroxylating dioxygenase subunit alpha [Myxococcota bacterium]
MKRDVEISILRELLRQLDEKRNVDAGVMFRNPTSVYTCPDLARREWEAFFRNHPQAIALSGSLPGPGSFMTVDDFGVPVLATRDADGRFRAFLNACRHRGARLAEGRGEAGHFKCPFHNWVYSNRGELAGIPLEGQFGRVDKACHGLVELPAVERHGLLWVHPRADGAIDLDAQLGELGPEIDGWGFGDLVHMGESVIEGRLNWKLANDTFGETYHFSRLHKDTLANLFHGDALGYEEFGRNHRFVIATRRIDALREKPEREWKLLEATNPLYYLFPNVQLSFSEGSASLIKMYPDPTSPSRSLTRVLHYFSRAMIDRAAEDGAQRVTAENAYERDFEEGAALTLSAFTEVFDSTIEQEDYRMGENQQRAAESGQLEHIVFGRNEPALHHYHTYFRQALGMPPLERFDS